MRITVPVKGQRVRRVLGEAVFEVMEVRPSAGGDVVVIRCGHVDRVLSVRELREKFVLVGGDG